MKRTGRELFALLSRAELLLTTLGLEPPLSMFLSLLGMRDVTLSVDREQLFIQQPRPFDRDVILFRELLIPTWGEPPEARLRPLLNEVSQAAGLERSRDYDDTGQWRPR